MRLTVIAIIGMLTASFAFNLQAAIAPSQIAIVVNVNDPDSIEIAKYYQEKRKIPSKNIIAVSLPLIDGAPKKRIGVSQFNDIRASLYQKTPDNVQFYALAWTKPFRVKCMSITSAITFGFDEAYCAKGCKPTKASQYFNSTSRQPYVDYGIRPSMLLAGKNLKEVKALIDRGVESDGTMPSGIAYLVSTSDKARNGRSKGYVTASQYLSSRVKTQIVKTDALLDKEDVLFYFTGLKKIAGLRTNQFLPGAIADHLTSTGGVLEGSRQMSALRWLEAGATASYGTVVEPCAFPQKFPYPIVVMDRYTLGESVIEAYWKSVAWPGQGVFIGEPMAAPYAKKSM